MRKQKGFSLIELLIVVAIILIIAAIAIPNLLRARMSANEASAVGSLRTINTAEVTYNTSYGGVFGTLANLGPVSTTDPGCTSTAPSAATACLIDSVLAGGTKSGYGFTVATANNASTYTANANPSSPGQTGQRRFFTDGSGVIRANTSASAAVTDGPI